MTFNVLLHFPKGHAAARPYALLGEKFAASGHTFVQLVGEQPTSDGRFLQFRLSGPKGQRGVLLWVPLDYVCMVYADEEGRGIGFGQS
jgi:hypothetical protein